MTMVAQLREWTLDERFERAWRRELDLAADSLTIELRKSLLRVQDARVACALNVDERGVYVFRQGLNANQHCWSWSVQQLLSAAREIHEPAFLAPAAISIEQAGRWGALYLRDIKKRTYWFIKLADLDTPKLSTLLDQIFYKDFISGVLFAGAAKAERDEEFIKLVLLNAKLICTSVYDTGALVLVAPLLRTADK